MKKFTKKILAIILCIMLSFQAIIVTASATNTNKLNEATNFLSSKNLLLGDVKNSQEIENGILLELQYLPNGEVTTIEYLKQENNEIAVRIMEANAEDIIIFKSNGVVTLDGEVVPYFNEKPATYDSGYYIYQYYNSLPAGWTHTYGNPSRFNDVVGTGSWTASTMATIIVTITSAPYGTAVAIASNVLATLSGPIADFFGFSITHTSWTNSTRSPFEVMKKHNIVIKVDNITKDNTTYYEVATLL